MSLTGVHSIIFKPRGAQLEVRSRVKKHYFIVVSISYFLVIFVPAHFQGMRAGGLAFKTVSFTLLHKGSGWKFQDKLGRFCKVKTRPSYYRQHKIMLEHQCDVWRMRTGDWLLEHMVDDSEDDIDNPNKEKMVRWSAKKMKMRTEAL